MTAATGLGQARHAPGLHVVEGVLVRDIVHDNDAVRAAVVRRGDCAEALLSCRVPDLELDCLSLELERPDLEVDTDGRDVGCASQSKEDARGACQRLSRIRQTAHATAEAAERRSWERSDRYPSGTLTVCVCVVRETGDRKG